MRYLGLHTTPADIAFCPEHRAQICYIAHVISVILKKSIASTESQPDTAAQVRWKYGYYTSERECRKFEEVLNYFLT